MAAFHDDFAANMEAPRFPAPRQLDANALVALDSARQINQVIEQFGRRVTVPDLVGAGLGSELLLVGGGMLAILDLGAVIGSIAVATGRVLGRGTALSDVLFYVTRHGPGSSSCASR